MTVTLIFGRACRTSFPGGVSRRGIAPSTPSSARARRAVDLCGRPGAAVSDTHRGKGVASAGSGWAKPVSGNRLRQRPTEDSEDAAEEETYKERQPDPGSDGDEEDVLQGDHVN